ncbi:hypothetical protein SAMN05443544_2239 [Agromyces cerinus subsp. cerinus]|uniref:Uncharacterized protein n=1 Tax=Agromyces cerinus subsp. cerinus TaxID=232089 RepID=A0A1N6G2H1_9MICO|nr:hypothetical protein SAMN05443544_2239 [Agromyces cerinus subsp. cerinus]
MTCLQSSTCAIKHTFSQPHQHASGAVRVSCPLDERMRVRIVEVLQPPYQPLSEAQPLPIREQQEGGGVLEDARCNRILLGGVAHTCKVIDCGRQLVSQLGRLRDAQRFGAQVESRAGALLKRGQCVGSHERNTSHPHIDGHGATLHGFTIEPLVQRRRIVEKRFDQPSVAFKRDRRVGDPIRVVDRDVEIGCRCRGAGRDASRENRGRCSGMFRCEVSPRDFKCISPRWICGSLLSSLDAHAGQPTPADSLALRRPADVDERLRV